MIRVYYLEIERIGNTDHIKGEEFIHHAILDMEGAYRKLIQDTTDEEDNNLSVVAISVRDAEPEEIAQLESFKAKMPKESARNLVAEVDEIRRAISEPTGVKGMAKRLDQIEDRISKLEAA